MPKPIDNVPPHLPQVTSYDVDVRSKLADHKVDAQEAADLTTRWGAAPVTETQAAQLRSAVASAQSTFDPGAKKIIGTFLRITLPTLVVHQPAGSPGTATLSWTPPTSREDGSPLTNLQGYRVSYGSAPGQYTKTVDITDPKATTFQVNGLTSGTWYFAMQAMDATGLVSGFSNEGSKTIP